MYERDDLQQELSTVAHLIHGSTEGRFRITYCPGHLSKAEIEGAGFEILETLIRNTIRFLGLPSPGFGRGLARCSHTTFQIPFSEPFRVSSVALEPFSKELRLGA